MTKPNKTKPSANTKPTDARQRIISSTGRFVYKSGQDPQNKIDEDYKQVAYRLGLADMEQEHVHRDSILSFVKRYIISSSIAIGIALAATIVLQAFELPTIDAWSLRLLLGGTVVQFIGVLHLITSRVFRDS